MATSETQSDDGSIDSDEPEPIWSVEGENVSLKKTSTSRYELSSGPVAIEFSKVRERDGEYNLRDYDRNTLGTFDPEAEDVPEHVGTAFLILVEEL